jgi:hypothetical protein
LYWKICGFSTFQVLVGGNTLCHYPAAQKRRGVKMRRADILTAATVEGGRENVQIYFIERAKKMSSNR